MTAPTVRRPFSGSGRGRAMGRQRAGYQKSRYTVAPMSDAGRARGAALPFILVTVLLDTLGVGLIIPVGPRLVASFLNDDLERASHWFGLLFAVYSVMQFFFAP